MRRTPKLPLLPGPGLLAGPVAVLALVLAAPAVAAPVALPDAVARDCTARPLTGTPGVHVERREVGRDRAVTFRLEGGTPADDWDLAVFDAAQGRLLGSSAGFGAREVVQVVARRGGPLLVQACRRHGPTEGLRLTTLTRRIDGGALARELRARPREVDVLTRDRDVVERLEGLGLDVTHDVRKGRVRVLLHGAADGDLLRRTGLRTRAVRRTAERATARAAQAPSGLPTGRTAYRTFDDYQGELKGLAERHPDRVRRVPIPTRTIQGREQMALEIADGVARTDDGRPTYVLVGMHHAREWPSAEAVMEFAHELAANPRNDPRIAALTKDVRVVVWPMVNPDGFNVSRTAPDPDPDEQTDVGFVYNTATIAFLLGGSLSYKRKNCNPLGAPSGLPCELAFGVDPNRNYGFLWGGPGASTNPNDQTYRGSGPFSEPEPRAVRDLVLSRNATMLISVHNVAALILRPPGLERVGFAPDEAKLKELGDGMAAVTGYTSQYGWQLYDTSGTTDDWSYAATGGFGYTVEMGPADGFFHGNFQRHVVDQYLGSGNVAGRGLREALVMAGEAAKDRAITSRITGRALPGRTLRLRKSFVTESSPVCAIAEPLPLSLLEEDPTSCIAPGAVLKQPETIDVRTVVPASSRLDWVVNPSTRPFEAKAGRTEAYTLECLDGERVVQRLDVVVARGEASQLELPCGGTLPPEKLTRPSAVRVSVGRVQRRGRTAVVPVTVRGGSLEDVRLRLLPRRGSKVLAETRRKRLRSSRKATRVTLRLRRGVTLKRGSLVRLQVRASRVKGSTVLVTRLARVR